MHPRANYRICLRRSAVLSISIISSDQHLSPLSPHSIHSPLGFPQDLLREEQGIVVENYEELAGAVFGPRAFRFCQTLMATLTLIYTSGFVIVISSSLYDVMPAVPRAMWCAIVFPILTLLSWVPFMEDLWFVSLLGLGTYLFGVVGSTLFVAARDFDPPPAPMAWHWEGAAHFYGVAVYSLEGINLTLPVSASMKSLRKPPLVMTVGVCLFAGITAFYASFAYAAGLGSCDIIIQCLGPGPFVNVIRVALALSLLATHPVYLIVASEIFERALLGDPSVPVPEALDGAQETEEAGLEDETEGAGTAMTGAMLPVVCRSGSHQNSSWVDHSEDGRSHAKATSPQRLEVSVQGEDNGREDGLHERESMGASTQSNSRTSASLPLPASISSFASRRLATRQAQARLIRAVEVFLTCMVGALIPNLGVFTSLVGATFVTIIGFIFPAAMWLELQREDTHASFWAKARVYGIAGLVIAAGLAAMVVGTVEGLRNLSS